MAPPLQATLVTGWNAGGSPSRLGEPPFIQELETSIRGQRDYWVNTHREDEALNALGLPQKGESWSPLLPLLIVWRRTTRYVAKQDDPVTQVGGLTSVRVEYQTNLAGSTPILPQLGKRWTMLGWSASTQTVLFCVNGDAAAAGVPIDNGNGFAKEVGVIEASVTGWYAPGTFDPYRFMPFKDKVNAGLFTLPRVWDSEHGLEVPAGGARYRGFPTPALESGLLKVVHQFALADGGAPGFGGHDLVWDIEDANGRPNASIRGGIYDRADFALLLS